MSSEGGRCLHKPNELTVIKPRFEPRHTCPGHLTHRPTTNPTSGTSCPPAAVGVRVEDSGAVGQAEPGLGAAFRAGAVAIQGAEHQPLPRFGERHHRQRLFRIIWLVGQKDERGGGEEMI